LKGTIFGSVPSKPWATLVTKVMLSFDPDIRSAVTTYEHITKANVDAAYAPIVMLVQVALLSIVHSIEQ
jgi:hypothetical protein